MIDDVGESHSLRNGIGMCAALAVCLVVGSSTTGCTVVGGAIGSGFDSDRVLVDAANVDGVLGEWVTCTDADGVRHEGTVSLVSEEYIVVGRDGTGFQSAQSDTVARGEIVTLETGGGHTGTAVGTAIGGAVDVALALTILYANSALGRAGMR